MTTRQSPVSRLPSALAPYRVLDLTEGGSNLGPRLLGDLGADVLRVEPPIGAPTRKMGPFINDTPDSENSLFWKAYNFNKRSITLNLETVDGRDIFKRLVKTADFLFESFPPGYLASLRLGYEQLAALNPRLIMASITPFGQTGPRASWQGPDLVAWAMGGYQWMSGDPDRAPLRVSMSPQSYFHASTSAALGSLMALQARYATGRGQHIDEAAQHCPVWMIPAIYQWYEYQGVILKRAGQWREGGRGTRSRTVYPCKDGHVVLSGGGGGGGRANFKLVELMGQDGLAPDWLKAIDWEKQDIRDTTQAEIDRRADAYTAWFKTKTKSELLGLAVTEGIFLAPVNTLADALNYHHLKERGFWVASPDPEEKMQYPGAPFVMAETPWRISRPAPRVGQHNQEVYCKELGFSAAELVALRSADAL